MKFKSYSVLIAAALAFSSCGKDFLEEKRDSKQVIIRNIADYQAVLDNFTSVNTAAGITLNLTSAAEYDLSDKDVIYWKGLLPYEVNSYLWTKEIWETKESLDWNNSYHRILLANLALDVEKVAPATAAEKIMADNVKGSARFIRAYSFYQLAQIFCKPYDAATASSDLGVPLKTDYDVKVVMPTRSTVAELYAMIIKDLEDAMSLVPEKQINLFRPGKATVAALLAKVYMHMGNWEKVFQYADQALKIKSNLMDFSKITGQAQFTVNFADPMPEVIFWSQSAKPSSTFAGMVVTPEVLALYEVDDYRRAVYFNAAGGFKGSLAGLFAVFSGYTTSELYLIRAEAYVRNGQTGLAMADLNELRKFRFPSTKTPLAITDETEALQFIKEERQRELYFRGIRWEDLRRFNKDPRFTTTIKHTYEGTEYSLAPNDIRYTLPLPDNEIQLNNYPQNPR